MRPKALTFLFASGLAGLSLAGCASTPEPVIGIAASQPVSSLGQEGFTIARPKTYLLRPSDKFRSMSFVNPIFPWNRCRLALKAMSRFHCSDRSRLLE